MPNKINSLKTINEVEEYRKLVNESCDKRIDFINLCIIAENASTKNFKYIKEAFENITPELFKTNEGKKIMNKYANTIVGNKNLSIMHMLCENIRKMSKDSDVDFFINNIANTEWNVDSKTIKEDTSKIGRILAEGIFCVGKKAIELLPTENIALENATLFIAENKKTNKNIANFSDAIKIIRESIISTENSSNTFENIDLDNLANELLESFNKKYSDKLNEEETKALKEMCCSSDRESIFNKYKSSCAQKISEAKNKYEKEGNNTASDRLTTVLEQVSNKKFSLDTVGSDICSLIELSSIFE